MELKATIAEIFHELYEMQTNESAKYRILQLQHKTAIYIQHNYDRTTYAYKDDSILHSGCDHMGWTGTATYRSAEKFIQATGLPFWRT